MMDGSVHDNKDFSRTSGKDLHLIFLIYFFRSCHNFLCYQSIKVKNSRKKYHSNIIIFRSVAISIPFKYELLLLSRQTIRAEIFISSFLGHPSFACATLYTHSIETEKEDPLEEDLLMVSEFRSYFAKLDPTLSTRTVSRSKGK